MRQTDLEPFAKGLQCLHLDTPLFKQQNTKKLYGTKINACMCSWGKFWTKDTKRPKIPNATFEEPGAKAGYCAHTLHTPQSKGWANHLSHPSSPTPRQTSTLNPHWEQAPPLLWEQTSKGTCCLFLLPSACSRGPNKTLPEKTNLSTNSLTLPLLGEKVFPFPLNLAWF